LDFGRCRIERNRQSSGGIPRGRRPRSLYALGGSRSGNFLKQELSCL
jgi:hypothetical protein